LRTDVATEDLVDRRRRLTPNVDLLRVVKLKVAHLQPRKQAPEELVSVFLATYAQRLADLTYKKK
jgi:hypothetical protein